MNKDNKAFRCTFPWTKGCVAEGSANGGTQDSCESRKEVGLCITLEAQLGTMSLAASVHFSRTKNNKSLSTIHEGDIKREKKM